MLLRCRPKCKLQDGMTTASLDPETNEVICDYCQEVIPNISPFTKNTMRANGDIIRREVRKAFVFECTKCNKMVEAEIRDGQVRGKGCQEDCQFNIPHVMIHNMKLLQEQQKEPEEDYGEDEE